MYEVLFRAEVVADREFDVLNREQQREMVRTLSANPRQQKPLQGPLRGYYRYRCGSIRVVFRADDDAETVTIVAIGQRRESEIYETAVKRV